MHEKSRPTRRGSGDARHLQAFNQFMSRLVREGQHQDLAGRDTALDQVLDAMDQCRRFTSTRPGNNVDEGFGRGSSIVLPCVISGRGGGGAGGNMGSKMPSNS